MATERIDIIVNEKGSRVVRRNFEGLGRSAKGADVAVRLLNRTLGLVASAVGIRQVQQMVDTYTNLQNRLRQVTTGTANLAAVTSNLFDIANRTRSSYEGTAELYARVALATKELGVSQRELLTFTERVNQAIILSGASAQEASAGLIQLSQGLASGTLRGDELRSVLEQLPAVADVIAKHLRVTRGELRQMGADAKITTDVVLAAFRNAENISADFANTVPTIGQAFTVLNNQLIKFIGETDQAYGVSNKLATAIIALSNNIDLLAKSLVVLGAALAPLLIRSALPRLLTIVSSLWRLIAMNPIGLLITALTGAAAKFIIFNDEYDEFLKSAGKTAGAMARVTAAFSGARAYIEKAWENFPEWFAGIIDQGVTKAIQALSKLGTKLAETTVNDAKQGKKILDFFGIPTPEYAERALKVAEGDYKKVLEKTLNFELPKDALNRTNKSLDSAAMAFKQTYLQTLSDMSADINSAQDELLGGGGGGGNRNIVDPKAVERFQRELRQLLDQIDPVEAAWRQWEEAQVTLNQAFAVGALDLSNYDEIMSKAYKTFEDSIFPVQALTREMDRQAELLQQEASLRERNQQLYAIEDQLRRSLTEKERQELDTRLRRIQLLQIEADILDSINQPATNYRDTVKALNGLLNTGAISLDQYNQKLDQSRIEMLELDRTIGGGVSRGLLKLRTEFTDLSQLAETTLTNAFKGAEDALVQFVTTGKASFSDLVNSILEDLVRLSIRQSITGPLAQMLGNFAGSWFGGSTAMNAMQGPGFTGLSGSTATNGYGLMPAFANGGDMTVGGSGGVDSQLVSFRATPGERVYVRKAGERDPTDGGMSVAMNVIIHNNANANVRAEETRDDSGQPQLEVFVDQVEDQLASRVRRGQGSLLPAMSEKLGVSSKPINR